MSDSSAPVEPAVPEPLGFTKLDGKVFGRLFSEKTGEEIPPDEYIVFRAHDQFMVPVLTHYFSMCSSIDPESPQTKAVYELRERVRRWQALHQTRMKLPDVDPGEISTEIKVQSIALEGGIYTRDEAVDKEVRKCSECGLKIHHSNPVGVCSTCYPRWLSNRPPAYRASVELPVPVIEDGQPSTPEV